MDYFMLYLGVCSVLFCFTIYREKVETGAVTVGDLLGIMALSFIPLVNLFFILYTLNFYSVLDKKVL